MYRFLGLEPPAKKQKTAEEKKNANRQYDNESRVRKFQTSWVKKFSWVRYDDNVNKMFCGVCEQHDQEGIFVKGCSNFRLESLIAHDKSESHKKSVGIKLAKSKQGPSEGEKALVLMNKAAVDKLNILFRNAHYIAKMGRPYTDYKNICMLDKAKGLDIGETYLTDKYCQKFVCAIAECRREEQSTVLESSPFVSIISDGSTDTSSTEAEIVYIKMSNKCKVSTMFVGIKNVPKGDAYHISSGISSLMTGRFGDIWRSKVVAMGTDGASVMIGKKSGVVQKIAEETGRPFIRSIHCSAHRLELAHKDATKDISMSKKCDLLLLNLYLFYKYSPLNRSNLKASFNTLGTKVVLPTRVGGTRWLPHTQRAICNVLTGYEALICHLEQMQATPSEFRKESSAKARNFLKLLKDDAVVAWLHFTMDIVKCLSAVSTTIQKQESTLADIWNELETAKITLQKYEKSDGPYLKKIKSGSGTEKIQIQRTKVINNLLRCLSERFQGDLSLFQSTAILSLNRWPDDLKKDIEFGDQHVAELVELSSSALKAHSNDVDIESIEQEWTMLKTSLENYRTKDRSALTWEELHTLYGERCPNLFLMIDYLLSLPGSSVDAERGFSCMKLVKNDWRSRLGEQNLSDLMLISMEVDAIGAFNPLPAIEKWYAGGLRARRPFYKDELLKNKCLSKKVVILNGALESVDEAVHVDAAEDEAEAVNNDDVADENQNLINGTNDCDDSTTSDDEDDESYFKSNDLRELQLKSYKMLIEMIKN